MHGSLSESSYDKSNYSLNRGYCDYRILFPRAGGGGLRSWVQSNLYRCKHVGLLAWGVTPVTKFGRTLRGQPEAERRTADACLTHR